MKSKSHLEWVILVHLKGKGKIKVNVSANGGIVRFSLSLEQSKYWGDLWGISNKYKTIFLYASQKLFLSSLNFWKIQSADFSHRPKLLMEVVTVYWDDVSPRILPHLSHNSISDCILHDCTRLLTALLWCETLSRLLQEADNGVITSQWPGMRPHETVSMSQEWPGHVASVMMISNAGPLPHPSLYHTGVTSLCHASHLTSQDALTSCGVSEAGPGNFPIF